MAHYFRVESITGERQPAIAKYNSPFALGSNGRTDAQQGEVAGPAAEIADQDQFVAIQGRFVIVGRGNGLIFNSTASKPAMFSARVRR